MDGGARVFKKILNVLSVVFLIIVVIIVIFSLTTRIMGNTPSLFGYYMFRVSSDSMEPTLMVGDVILVRSADAQDIRNGDIVTYKSQSGSMYGREVTHRVVTEPEIKNGTYYYQTQGDAAGAPAVVVRGQRADAVAVCQRAGYRACRDAGLREPHTVRRARHDLRA